jgi:hypothetical protein
MKNSRLDQNLELPRPGDTRSPGSHAALQPVLLNVWSYLGHHVLYGMPQIFERHRKISSPAKAG